jgi:hypothetical protein
MDRRKFLGSCSALAALPLVPISASQLSPEIETIPLSERERPEPCQVGELSSIFLEKVILTYEVWNQLPVDRRAPVVEAYWEGELHDKLAGQTSGGGDWSIELTSRTSDGQRVLYNFLFVNDDKFSWSLVFNGTDPLYGEIRPAVTWCLTGVAMANDIFDEARLIVQSLSEYGDEDVKKVILLSLTAMGREGLLVDPSMWSMNISSEPPVCIEPLDLSEENTKTIAGFD